MPRNREDDGGEKVYSIKELSEEARERVLDKWRYDEMEYHQSDEYITDFLEGNDYKFDEDGEEL